ncbi:MAG: hydrogenase nickel incorporation protein HypA [Verrucomicrobiota bacterium]|nr:hydrogenase nickel incorporation protein HypA [Opitutales bacterium]
MLQLTAAAVAYCALVGGVFLALWSYYDRRDHARFEVERRKTTFHCRRCDALYSAPAGTDLAPCPRCDQSNARLSF